MILLTGSRYVDNFHFLALLTIINSPANKHHLQNILPDLYLGPSNESAMKALLQKYTFFPIILFIAALGYSPTVTQHFIYPPLSLKNMFQDTVRKVCIDLEQVVLDPITVLYIRDTAAMAGLSKVFEKDYAEILRFISKNGLSPGRVMAFYFNDRNPMTLEAAVEVDRVPETLAGRIRAKVVPGGDALVAHYTGPYEELEKSYNEIAHWLEGNTFKAREIPFEIYLNDPTKVKDHYDLKTDIYQLLK